MYLYKWTLLNSSYHIRSLGDCLPNKRDRVDLTFKSKMGSKDKENSENKTDEPAGRLIIIMM